MLVGSLTVQRLIVWNKNCFDQNNNNKTTKMCVSRHTQIKTTQNDELYYKVFNY